MAIGANNLKLFKSQRLSDTPDGGGRMTGDEVVDGASNNLFPDVSQLARAYGEVRIKKVYLAVVTATTDTYLGANVIVAKPPTDPNVRVCIFSTGSWSDERSAAQNRVESYVAEGALSELKLLGNHIEGQRQILAYQRTSAALPEIGNVYMLRDETVGVQDHYQYVRVTDVAHEDVVYVDDAGSFAATQVRLDVSDPLRFTFPGGVPNRLSSYQPVTKIKSTEVVDASRYYGVTTLAADAANGALEIEVGDIYTALLPGAQSTTAVLDVQAGGDAGLTIVAGTRTVTVSQVNNTASTSVTLANQGYNYTLLMDTPPGPGTLTVGYMVRGRWYTINDADGAGVLTGAGVGVVNYATRSASVTLHALPDVGSAILWAWGTGAHYERRDGISVQLPALEADLGGPFTASTLAVEWQVDGTTYTAASDATGSITGDASGSADAVSGRVRFSPNAWPAADTQFSVTATRVSSVEVPGSPGSASTILTVNSAAPAAQTGTYSLGAAVKPGTVTGTTYVRGAHVTAQVVFFDNGAGVLLGYWKLDTVDGRFDLQQVGVVDYATGDVALTVTTFQAVLYQWQLPAWVENTEPCDWYSGAPVSIQAYAAGAPSESVTIELQGTATAAGVTSVPVVIDIVPGVNSALVPGSVEFSWLGHTYIDRDGSVYRDVDPDTGAGTLAGAIDYAAHKVSLTNWGTGSGAIQLLSALTVYGEQPMATFVFRTPGAPVQPGGFQIYATATDGTQFVAVANSNGEISGDGVVGYIDQQFGVVYVAFPTAVIPSTVRFNVVVVTYLPLSSGILGLDPVRLPLDGRVPMIRAGDVVVVHNTVTIAVQSPVPGLGLNASRTRLARVELRATSGDLVPAAHYTADLDAGTIVLSNELDLLAYPAPWTFSHTVEDMALVAEATIDGRVKVTRPLSRSYSAAGTYVSSALIAGDLQARVTNVFEMETWTEVWADTLGASNGSAPAAQFNDVQFPIVVTNAGATQERWRFDFYGTTAFIIVGETIGVVGSYTINDDVIAPINPATGVPYFTVNKLAFGLGWAAGNQLRFETRAANYPIWVVRSVMQSVSYSGTDDFRLQIRGDVDA